MVVVYVMFQAGLHSTIHIAQDTQHYNWTTQHKTHSITTGLHSTGHIALQQDYIAQDTYHYNRTTQHRTHCITTGLHSTEHIALQQDYIAQYTQHYNRTTQHKTHSITTGLHSTRQKSQLHHITRIRIYTLRNTTVLLCNCISLNKNISLQLHLIANTQDDAPKLHSTTTTHDDATTQLHYMMQIAYNDQVQRGCFVQYFTDSI